MPHTENYRVEECVREGNILFTIMIGLYLHQLAIEIKTAFCLGPSTAKCLLPCKNGFFFFISIEFQHTDQVKSFLIDPQLVNGRISFSGADNEYRFAIPNIHMEFIEVITQSGKLLKHLILGIEIHSAKQKSKVVVIFAGRTQFSVLEIIG